jgi:crossover junction endodeoxyribonuclease RusA
VTDDEWGRPPQTSHPTPNRWELVLPWTKPPMSLNDRMDRWTKARWTKTLRQTAWALAKQAKIPPLHEGCQVGLVYQPPDRRRRDEDNLFATLKPLADGLVDAGVVADDTPDLMRKECRITDPVQPSKLTLHVIANTGRWLW